MAFFLDDGPGMPPIGGNAGWVGAGLLSTVLMWLFIKHLPAKDEQIRHLLAEARSQLDSATRAQWAAVERLSEQHLTGMAAVAREFKEATLEISRHADRNEERLVRQLEMSRETFIAVVHGKAVLPPRPEVPAVTPRAEP